MIGTDSDGSPGDAFEGNLISGNASNGVYLAGASTTGNHVTGNRIGTGPDGTQALANGANGVELFFGASSNVIGTDVDGSPGGAAEGNTIAFNAQAGVAIIGATTDANSLLGNRIFSNAGLGIDLGGEGATANDPGDSDTGANQNLNFPELTDALHWPATLDLDLTYVVDTAPTNATYPLRIDFFETDPDLEEGATPLGVDLYTVADYSGCGTPPCAKTVRLPNVTLGGVAHLVATTTDDAAGDFDNTSEFSAPVPVSVVLSPDAPLLTLHFWLEGAFTGSGLRIVLASSGTLDAEAQSQPYAAAPWAYPGSESVADFATALPEVVDWVLVELRSGDPMSPPMTVEARQAALLLGDGSVVDVVTGQGPLGFLDLALGPYYVVVYHRNHLAVMSAAAVDFSSGPATLDFRTGGAYSAGGMAMKALGSGQFGLFAADANADGEVTALDFNPFNQQTTTGATGYRTADFNLDGHVTALDFNRYNVNTTTGASSQVPGATPLPSPPPAVASAEAEAVEAEVRASSKQ